MVPSGQGAQIRLQNLYKSFGSRTVLEGVDLEVAVGDFVAIVGQSGCGKSTLLRLVAGLERPTSGHVYVDGEPVHGLNPVARVMFQDARLLPWQRVLENVGLGLQDRGQHKARRALGQVGLAERAHDWPAVLSGGQRQRVALARALASEPRMLLLDEPLGALDALTRIEMQQLIEGLWHDQRFTALLVTHDVEEAVAMANRVVVIDTGQIAMEVTVNLPRPRQRGSAAFAAIAGH